MNFDKGGELVLPENKILTIYTYDSMVSDWGLGPVIVSKFEKKCDCTVKMIGFGDAGQVLNRLILEKDNPKADLVIGIDSTLSQKAIKANVLQKFTPKNINIVSNDLRFDSTNHLTPYDFGFIAFVYDSESLKKIPLSLEDLTKPEFKDKIIIEDPRTSSPGFSLLLWTVAEFGEEGYVNFWKKFKNNVLTVTSGWDEAYGLFQAGEAPIVLSYATSPAYHVEFEKNFKYKALNFDSGLYRQIEAIGIVKGSKNKVLAQEFVEFSLTSDFQSEIPLTQWVFPVNQEVQMPKSYNYAVNPEIFYELSPETISKNQNEWLAEWEKIFS